MGLRNATKYLFCCISPKSASDLKGLSDDRLKGREARNVAFPNLLYGPGDHGSFLPSEREVYRPI